MKIHGEWNGQMMAKMDKQSETVFLDVAAMEICRKQCRSVMKQEEMESRRCVVVVVVLLFYSNLLLFIDYGVM
jgi:hypothetical protein